MSQVNDPKESRFSAMLYSSGLETVALKELHNRLRQFHESRVKVACFSRDDPGIAIFAHQTFQGWAKPAMWAHYGGDHTGVCVVFNQRSLVKSFCTKFAGHTRIFHGNMNYQQIKAISPKYLETQYETHKVHIRANETLADFETTVLEYLNKHHGAMYFCKHGDWSGEREYRLLVVSPKDGFEYLDITDSLVGACSGFAMPEPDRSQIENACKGSGLFYNSLHQGFFR